MVEGCMLLFRAKLDVVWPDKSMSSLVCIALRYLHLAAGACRGEGADLILDAPALQARLGVDVCPRTCPAAGASLCTYYRWFDRPRALRRPGPLLMQPLSARCMRTLLRFRLGAHSLPVVMGRRTGTPRAQRLCQQCDQHAVGDERHMVLLQAVRDKYAALFTNGACTMQQFSWTSLVLLTL